MLNTKDLKEVNKAIEEAKKKDADFLTKQPKEFRYDFGIGHWGNKKSLIVVESEIGKAIAFFESNGVAKKDIQVYGSKDYNSNDFNDHTFGFIGTRLETDEEFQRRTKDYKGNKILKLTKEKALVESRIQRAIDYLRSHGIEIKTEENVEQI